MLETGGILIVMGAIFAAGAAGEWILSLFYRRYLRDTADMERPGKKLVKLTKLRYETSYYLNGTVHNAKTMVDGMLEHYRLAGLRLWTWHHIATMAAFLCGAIGFVIGGAYVAGRYIPEVKEVLPVSGMNAIVYTLAGGALAAMLFFWQNLLDNRAKRRRLETNLVDYFDNEKFHQLGREIALSGRVREIAGDRGRREDPGSVAVGTDMSARSDAKAAENPSEMEEADAGNMNERRSAEADGSAVDNRTGRIDADAEESLTLARGGEEAERMAVAAAKAAGKKGDAGVMTISDIISPEEAFKSAKSEADESSVRPRGGVRKKTTATSARTRAKNVQIAQEEMEERKAGSRRREKASRDVIIPLNPENSQAPNGQAASLLTADSPVVKGVTVNGMAENGKEMEERDRLAELEAAATAAAAPSAAKRRRSTGKSVSATAGKSASTPAETDGKESFGAGSASEDAAGNLYGDLDRASREEELLRLLREYMGL